MPLAAAMNLCARVDIGSAFFWRTNAMVIKTAPITAMRNIVVGPFVYMLELLGEVTR